MEEEEEEEDAREEDEEERRGREWRKRSRTDSTTRPRTSLGCSVLRVMRHMGDGTMDSGWKNNKSVDIVSSALLFGAQFNWVILFQDWV